MTVVTERPRQLPALRRDGDPAERHHRRDPADQSLDRQATAPPGPSAPPTGVEGP
ncbi:hypothetical protein [Actinacidiphila acidipaludis]|uniref:Uncharacterized protein n=1 Tax=Actinacidiphila acidipaludis TaxID=2873382 RepID=A0ABS7Q3Y7_9ACTN|nr:hypothetical protein [Streptomyces acidipaludis]MBY8877561.1 hypothetical protein [Streptomyces acidipaludis]